MSQTISKHIGEGFGKGEIYAALAYDASDAFGGMKIKGICAGNTTATTALNTIKMGSDFTGTASTYHIANFFLSAYTGTGTGSLRTVVGQVDYSGTQATVTTPAQYLVGVHGRAKVSGVVYNTQLCLTGVHAQILPGGAYTAANQVAPLWADWQLASAISGITTTAIAILSNNANSATGNPTNVMYIYAPLVTNLIKLYGATEGGMVSADIGATAIHKTICRSIKINIDGVTFYLLASTAPAAS